MPSIEERMLKELENISFLMGDVNAIRNGEYEPPRGADPSDRHRYATPDDIYAVLTTSVGHLERQSEMIYNIGLNAVENKDFWRQQNSRH
jgi:hypothetical protein